MIRETPRIQEARRGLLKLLGAQWSLTPEPAPLLTWRLTAPDGTAASLTVLQQERVRPGDVPTLARRQAGAGAGRALVVARYVGPTTRALLTEAGLGYHDETGNLHLALEHPMLILHRSGADRDPAPPTTALGSLRGRAACRAVRALLDHAPPFELKALADTAGLSPATLSRVCALLTEEGLLTRSSRRAVTDLDWRGVLRRWTADYSVMGSNHVARYVDPLPLTGLSDRLAGLALEHVWTGAFAAAARLDVPAPPRLAELYVRDAGIAADQLGLVPATRGVNVILLTPRDSVAFERLWAGPGRVAAPSQVAADLLTGPGRDPAVGEAVVAWMAEHEGTWRAPL